MSTHPILINGHWQPSASTETFQAINPATNQPLPGAFPVSTWQDIDSALSAAVAAAKILRQTPAEQIAKFLTRYAERIEARTAELTAAATLETALPVTPRLKDIELPRTTTQLRQAAAAALEASWASATIDTKNNIRSTLAPLGPIFVIGPNNFPLAFNGISGGDFAAAIAAGNPVIAKGHPSHPNTTRLLAEEARAALADAGLPLATVQLLYHMSPADGLRTVADPRLGATGFTGSRAGGMALKAAADKAGKPIYLEMSSLNPVVILPGALKERGEKIVVEYVESALAGNGQFCTKPGIVILMANADSEKFLAEAKTRFESRAAGPLFSANVGKAFESGINKLVSAGATLLTGGKPAPNKIGAFTNTLLRTDAAHFLTHAEALQTEAFGNASLAIVAQNSEQVGQILNHLEGQLTGCVYSDTQGSDDAAYDALAPALRTRVGRLLNDKMPTGVALSPAMNHGGPYPSTGHPGFSAVGIPGSLRRFAQLESYDNVRPNRLPTILQNQNPTGKTFRQIDGRWTTDNLA